MSGEAEHEIYKRRAGRNVAVAVTLGVTVALLFAVTIVKVPTQPFVAYNNPGAPVAAGSGAAEAGR